MELRWRIVINEREFEDAISDWSGSVACDVETFRTKPESGQLLGISLSPSNNGTTQCQALYVPFNHFENGLFTSRVSDCLVRRLGKFFQDTDLIGHNFTYDKRWVDSKGYTSRWVGDTRIAWHLASAPAGPRPYDLKSLQIELLGWEERGDKQLEENVKSKGGVLKNGDHYLADLDILAKYACLDTFSTSQGWNALKPFFDKHSYHWMLHKMMEYNLLLEQNTREGVEVDVAGLQKAHNRLIRKRDAAKKRLDKALEPYILELERDWLQIDLNSYSDTGAGRSARETFLKSPHRWKRFNWNSDPDKRLLFYHKLGNEVIYLTKGKKEPATNYDAITQMKGDWVESYLKYEKANTLVSNFTSPYLEVIENGKIHPGFNICATVSYRLGGFKPYLLNAPFDEKEIYKNFRVPKDWVGVGGDLKAIEPCVTAHYSDDHNLLKVFRDGLGDIYLDLALGLFPHDHELRLNYNPREPVTDAIKKRFARQRKIAKIIHLAVSYTGTKTTVHRNLQKEGIDVSIWEADRLVQAYWKTFYKVKRLADRLRELNRREGLLRNVIGRIIRVPDPDYKDLFNRFIQSSGHDVLVLWVLEIARLSKEWGIDMRPVVIDIHDFTGWMVEKENKEAGMQILEKALSNVNDQLKLSVRVQMEGKYFNTLAGIKVEDL